MPTRFQTYSKDVKLLPGQVLHFTKGKGYSAGPGAAPAPYPGGGPAEPKSGAGGNPYAPTPRVVRVPVQRPGGPTAAPAAPPVDPYAARTPAEIDALAAAQAQAGLTPQQNEIRRQQALAKANAVADEGAIRGFQTAASGLLAGIAPEITQAYDAAGNAIGQIGTGVGGAVGADLAAKRAADAEFQASQGQSGGTSDNGETGNVVGMLGGVLPGTEFAQEGAARAAGAAEAVAIPLNAGREELAARMSQARTENDQYAQQLIQLAAQFPDLKAQALQQLNQYELDKANYRRGIASDAEQKRVDTANIASQRRSDDTQARAERANEAATKANADLNAAYKADESNYRWASLDFKTKAAATAAKKAAASGKRIDVQASKLLGHIVYKDGTEDPSLKVKQTTSTTDPAVKAKQNRAKAVQTARQSAYKVARTTFGTPTLNKNQGVLGGPGKYIADPTQKYGVPGGVFPPVGKNGVATTNDPRRAARTGGASDYAQAQTQVWAAIAGDSLMSRYGLSREQVMGYVNAALKAAGWKR